MDRDAEQQPTLRSNLGREGARPSAAADASAKNTEFIVSAPPLSLPKGGGAIRGIGEKFAANPVTGTATMSVSVYSSPGRSGFGPQLALSYDSGTGNGTYGYGWSLSTPQITRRTDRGLPKYEDADESDIFVLSGAEDLVPVLETIGGKSVRQVHFALLDGKTYSVHSYRPRIEGLFARIERWVNVADLADTFWRSISRDNVTTWYGKRTESRVCDPGDTAHVFTWLICESYDDRGNAILYKYKSEDAVSIDSSAAAEQNRLARPAFSQRYLKRIKYGNRTPRGPDEDLSTRDDWLFELVFDYGEHDLNAPTTAEVSAWRVRADPFSSFRSTFDIRTYRLCRRVLMFHHFPDELGGEIDTLVRSTDISYQESANATLAVAITQTGYAKQPDKSYVSRSMPSVQFRYSEAIVDETVHDVDSGSVRNLPVGLDGNRYQWIDLDSEGLNGVLTEQPDGWYYKRNLGSGSFGPIERVSPLPSTAALGRGQQLLDLAGEGRLDLVTLDGPLAGFHSRADAGDWEGLTRFRSIPDINPKDANLRFVDVTGDGHADILISEDQVFTFYESLAKDGFAPMRRSPKAWDEDEGPRCVFSEPTETIFLADMSGDGLTDIVRIRYCEICYWPNLGYGRFGAKVTMGNAPLLDSPDLFDPKRIHLADIDGSGTTDIVYVGRGGISLYFNESGNSWTAPRTLTRYPRVDNLKSIAAIDLLGNGTACLVWSSPLASDVQQPMRYIDLMSGQKPHLLLFSSNNMGAETEVHYTASTSFYLQDAIQGRPWVTKLPFPVHVLDRVEHRDLVSGTKLVSTYRYRHGYFDGVEREFRGFAYVEQRDAESVVGDFDLPPIVTKTWFHNGAFLKGKQLEAYFKEPASGEYFTGDATATFLPDTDLPPDLSYDEMREAARALKGSILRQEIYADDGTAKAALPYAVSERSYRLKVLQPLSINRHAVFFAHSSETIDYHYERDVADPRVSHALTLAVDDYGNVLQSVTIGYARRTPAFDEQKKTLTTLAETAFTNPVWDLDAYRSPLPTESKTYELTSPTLKGADPMSLTAAVALVAAATEIAYEAAPTLGQTEKRLIEQMRTLYRKNDLSAFLPLGKLESMALPGESYKMALTPGLLDLFQAKATRAELISILTGPDARYRSLDGSPPLWVSSGQVFYSPTFGDSAAQERAFAQGHFFLPQRFQDPFGNTTTVAYDGKYNLLLVTTQDAVGNQVMAEPDFRVLQPTRVTDPNGNRSEARFDALGMLAGTAVRGKATGPAEGDSFDNFVADLTPAQIKAFFDAADPRALAVTSLGSASTRIVYDLERVPVCAAAIARETHVSDLAQGQQTKVQLHFVYSDGFGREAQTKAQAEPGPLDPNDPASPVLNPRWVGTGAKVYNNKGKPVRQYEPFFSPGPAFGIEKQGVSSTLFYDPVERVVAILHPNNSFEKVVFDPWQQTSWDVNDTVTFDPKTDPDVGEFFSHLPDGDYLPTWYQQRVNGQIGPDEKNAADKAAKHADTPTIAHFDTLGRTFLTIADNGKDANDNDQKFRTGTVLDIEGNQRQVIDALGRIVMRYDYDMLGTRIHQASMEAGERWMLNDVSGKPIRAWNSRKYAFRTEYDALHRPLRSFAQGGDAAEVHPKVLAQEILFERTLYGDSADTGLTDVQMRQANLRGKPFRHFDGAGTVTTDQYDFKGNPLRSSRQFATDYKNAPDWSQSLALEAETFTSSTAYDALNRPSAVTAPDRSIYRPTFNEANLLDRVEVTLRGAASATAFVTNVDYNAKGQRTLIAYGNGARTTYEYDARTFRLTHLKTTRKPPASGLGARLRNALGMASQDIGSQIFKNAATVQDLRYVYDPAGNITRIADGALQTVFHSNQQVDPANEYTYDPLYRLISATGREHIGQSAFQFVPTDGSYRDYPFVGAAQQNDLQALRNYTEQYQYDPVGNFLKMAHQAANGGWARSYTYADISLIEPARKSNRLSQTALQTSPAAPVEPYPHDAHGNMTQMPHLPIMQWDFKDQMCATARQVVNAGTPEMTFYVYDAGGQRARKVTERQNSSRKNERFYVGGFEVYREYDGSGAGISLARETLHVMDDKRRIALIETQTVNNGNPIKAATPAQRYQFGNHLGSACLELNESAELISYEEYTPYGCSGYQAGRSAAEISLKRYRYAGKERDEETAFTYHGARYCCGWLGRWISCDPIGIRGFINLFVFCDANPMTKTDDDGMWAAVIGLVIVVAIILVTIEHPANAPSTEDVKKGHVEDRPPLAEDVARATVVAASGGAGGAAGKAVAARLGGSALATVVGGAAGGAVGGGTSAVGQQSIDDVKSGQVSAPSVYAKRAGKEALAGAALGGALATGGVAAQKLSNAAKPGGGGSALRGGNATPRGGGAAQRTPPSDPYDAKAWDAYYRANPSARRSLSAAAADDPTVFPKSVPEKQAPKRPGKLGTPATRAQNAQIAKELHDAGYDITGGGGVEKETYFPSPYGTRKGSVYADVSAEKPGDRVHAQTTDTNAQGMPDTRELRNAGRLLKADREAGIFLIPKSK